MRKMSLLFVLLMIFALVLIGCGNDHESPAAEGTIDEAAEINIAAAASLTDALTEIQTAYAAKSNNTLHFNFASSGTLVKQLQEGAPGDLFISASKGHMDTLEEEGLIVTASRKDLLINTLTLIATAEKADLISGTEALTGADIKSIAIGEPESVPAGKYARQTLENLGLWEQIQDKIIYTKDVRQVLQYVDSGNADCGFVYKSDALLLETGKVIKEMLENSHDPIVYPAALLKDSAEPEATQAFYEYLQTDEAKGIFKKYGFQIL